MTTLSFRAERIRPADKNKTRRAPGLVIGRQDGPSRIGSSYYKQLIRCPREHALQAIAGLRRVGDKEALTVGWLFHHALETYYTGLRDGADPSTAERAAIVALEPIAEEPDYEETYETVLRVCGTYFDFYRGKDDWRIIAVEETLEYVEAADFEYSARIDLVIEQLPSRYATRAPGLYVVEHKTARYLSEDLLVSYQLDLQILGQVWLMRSCVNLASYPPFKGVIVNIITKQKKPECERVEVCPSPAHVADFERQMRLWYELRDIYAAMGWPKHLGACSGFARGYTVCPFYDICHAFPEMSVESLAYLAPPFGYCREEDSDVDA